MKKTRIQAPQSSAAVIERETIFAALQDTADSHSIALHHINNVVLLAAFACEARRTLAGIGDVLKYEPEVKETIADRVAAVDNWSQFDDVVSDVLQNVSTQIQALSELISERPFDLRKMYGGVS